MSRKRKAVFSFEEDNDGESPKDKKKKKQTTTVSEADSRFFIKFYNSLPPRDSDLVRFFSRKDFYTVCDENASFIAEEMFKTTRVVKHWKDNKGPPYVDLKPIQFQEICRVLILEKKWRVEVYSFESGKWELIKKASPGNISELEDVIFADDDMQESQVMLAVQIGSQRGQRVVGVAFVDVSLRQIGTLQFMDTDQLINLESLFYQVGVKECLCLSLDIKDKDSKKLHEILDRLDIKRTEKKKTDFKVRDIEQDLRRLLGKKYWNSIGELDDKLAIGAASCLIDALGLMGREEYHGSFVLKRYDLDQYMRLDSAAIMALNVLPNPREPNQKQNLYGLLNKCRTPMGSRLLMQWIKQPLKDIHKIQERLDIVEIFVQEQTLNSDVRSICFKRIPDLERISKKIQCGRAGLQECVIIYQFIQHIEEFVKVLEGLGHENKDLIHTRFTERFKTLAKEFKTFEDLVEETVDLEMVDQGEYMVNASFDEVLQELRDKKRHVQKSIDQHEDDTRTLLGSPASFKLESDKTHGHHFKLSRKDTSCLETKETKNKYTIILNNPKGVKFQDAKMEKLTLQYKEITENYLEQSKSLIKEIMQIAASYMPVLEEAHQVLAELDVFTNFAYASYSAIYPYVKPTLSPLGQGDLALIACRHPVLEAQSDFTYIPNNALLTRGESSFQIITGPNMGGKSTFIRSIGVVVLMAQMGCFVPCETAHIPLRDAILARVGASDSQLRGVSTFMAEMLETATILNTATDKSLIIIDELGRGTSTYDGFGLAWAISEFICTKIDAFCLFATHFHELTQLEEEIPVVKNFHVVAEPDTKGRGLTLLYEVKPGPSDQSFGIHVAKLANFPEDVIEVAKAKAQELENFDTTQKLKTDDNTMEDVNGEDNDMKEGKEIIQTVLEEFAKQPIDKLNDDEIEEYINSLKDQICKIDNSYINKLLEEVH